MIAQALARPPCTTERMANGGKTLLHHSHARHVEVPPERKVTAIEVMIAASAVLVLVVLAVPSFSQSPARSALKSAREIVESSIVHARQTARIYQTEVVLSVQTGLDQPSSLSYLVHVQQQSPETLDFRPKNYEIPTGVRLVADRNTIRFNAKGEVVPHARLVLVSTSDSDLSEHILLE